MYAEFFFFFTPKIPSGCGEVDVKTAHVEVISFIFCIISTSESRAWEATF